VAILIRIVLLLVIVCMAVSTAIDAQAGILGFSVGPINVYLFDLVLLVAVVLLMREGTLRQGRPIPSANRTVIALVFGYCAYQIAVVLPIAVAFYGLDPIVVARQLETRLALMLIPFVYLAGLKYVSPQRIVSWVNVAAVAVVCFGLYKYATVGLTGYQVSGGAFRLKEIWVGGALLSGFLVITSLFLRRPSAFAYVLALLGLLGMALTNHRSGYVALLFTVPPLLVNAHRIGRRAAIILLVAASGAFLLFSVSPTARDSIIYSFRTMLNPNADQTARDRVDRSRLGWDYFVEHPLGDYAWSGRFYLVDLDYPFEPHNFVIQLLGQQGIVGFALVAGMFAATARIGWRNQRNDRMSAVMLAYFAFYLLFCLFNTSLLNTNNVLLLILPIALILGRNATLAEEAGAAEPSVAGVGLDRPLPANTSLL